MVGRGIGRDAEVLDMFKTEMENFIVTAHGSSVLNRLSNGMELENRVGMRIDPGS